MNMTRYVGPWCNRPEARQSVCRVRGKTARQQAAWLLRVMREAESVCKEPVYYKEPDGRVGLGLTASWVYGIHGNFVCRMSREDVADA